VKHSPSDRPRLIVSGDGSLGAVVEAARVVVVDVPHGSPLAEITAPSAVFEVGWLGTRLLILSRYDAHTTVHLIDPHGPETIAEIELQAAVALFGTVNTHALVIGAQNAAVLTAFDTHLAPYIFPARAPPTVAGAAANQFVVAIPGVIEEWDPVSRVPKRRLRLPRPTTITQLGGSDRVVWMITQQEPTRVDVLPLINRGQPKVHELPEPIAFAAGHPKSDLLALVGQSGRAYAIDLDGRTRLRTLAFAQIDQVEAIALVQGTSTGVLAAQRGRPLAFTPLEARDPTVRSTPRIESPRAEVAAESEVAPEPEPVAPPPPRMKLPLSPLASAPLTPTARAVDLSAAIEAVPAPKTDDAKSGKTATNLAARFAAVRERREAALAETVASPVQTITPRIDAAQATGASPSAAGGGPIASMLQAATSFIGALASQPAARVEPEIQPRAASRDHADGSSPAWRDACVAWARSIVDRAGAFADRPFGTDDASATVVPIAAPLDALAARFGLSTDVVPALVLIYGAHLAGHDGVAPADIARVLEATPDRRWEEALGRGELAAAQLVEHARSRVRIAEVVLRLLDELPPLTGVLVGTPREIALLAPCAIVADDPAEAAAHHADRAGGAILVGTPEHRAAVTRLEAKALGAVAMIASKLYDGDAAPAIYIADDELEAARLGLPRL
jgi:hypothetical protein